MLFRFTLLTALMVINNPSVVGSGQCSCPLEVDSNNEIVKGECKNKNGSSADYKRITLVNVNINTGLDRCNRECEAEGNECQGWAFRDDNVTISSDEGNCRLYRYKANGIKKNKRNAEKWECHVKGALLDTFSFFGDGKCQNSIDGGSTYTELRAYTGEPDLPQNPTGKIESLEACKDLCKGNAEIEEEYFFYEPGTPNKPGSACEGFDFVTERCNDKTRCLTNCYLMGNTPTSNRTKPSRQQIYDNYSCYARDCECP